MEPLARGDTAVDAHAMRPMLALLLLLGTASAERLRAPDGTTKDYPADEVDYLTKHGYSTIGTVKMRDGRGAVVDVYEDLIGDAMARGYTRMSDVEIAAESEARARESLARTESEIEHDEGNRTLLTVLGAVGIVGVLGLLYWRFAVRA